MGAKIFLTSLFVCWVLFSQAQNIWMGNTNTNWNTPGNWSLGTVPLATDDVVIPSLPMNQPTIMAGTAGLSKSVQVQSGATLTIANMASLTVSGNIFFSGLNVIAFFNQGTVENSGQVILSNTSSAAYHGLDNRGTFNNNIGGELKIDNTTQAGIFNGGTINNAAKITIGATGSVGNYGLYTQATFNNNMGGDINIDRVTEVGLAHVSGIFTNVAQITIGANSSVGQQGLYNQATFNNNNGGNIRIDRATSDGLVNDNNGTVSNLGTIDIGSIEAVGSHGIRNQANFNNNAGQININRAGRGLLHQIGTFNNWAGITIGGIGGIGDIGLLNLTSGTFNNNSGGQITIDRSTFAGIVNQGTTFHNSGMLTIGSVASVGQYGLQNNGNGTFNNNTGGEIKIDNATSVGLYNESGIFTNVAKITIGAITSIGTEGIYNAGTFNNNAGGDIKIDRSSLRAILNHTATFNNAALITIGASASVGSRGLNNFGAAAVFNNNAGEIKIDNATSIGLYNESGTFSNVAKITIGATTGVGGEGINNRSTFNNNTGGTIQMDQTGSHALVVGAGIFTNEAIMRIGSNATTGGRGIRVEGGTFNNNLGGDISINRATITGITNFATFINSALLTLGNIAFSAGDNIQNQGTFTNTITGEIRADRATSNGIRNVAGTFGNYGKIFVGSSANTAIGILNMSPFSNNAGGSIQLDRVTRGMTNTSTFTNAGQIRMGNNVALGERGLLNGNGTGMVMAVFNNLAGSLLQIDQTPANQDGITNELLTTFTNTGTVSIGTLGSIGGNGITNAGTFSNNACATLTVFDNLNNSSIFTNTGLFTVNTAQAHTNTALTNNGIIEYPQGNPIPNVTNNDVIVAPITVCGTTFSPALQIGGMNDFTVGTTWYKELAFTNTAGTYSPNTFTVTNLTAGSTYPLYFEITDPVNTCTRKVGINVTVNALPTVAITGLNAAYCKNNPAVTLTGTPAGGSFTIDNVAATSFDPAALTVGPHSVVYTYTDANTCTNTATQSVTVNPLLTASISGTTAVCKDAPAPNVTFTGANGTAPYTFTYKINNGPDLTVTTSSGNSVTVSQSTATTGSFEYTLVSVKESSATMCSQAQIGSATVTVNPLPTASISGTTSVCQNAASPNVTFTGANGTAPYTFTYKINNGPDLTVTTISGNSVTVSQSTATVGPFEYTLVSVKEGSATMCSQAQSGSATVTVNPLPTASISGTTSVCQNAPSPNVTFTGAGGTAPYTFTYKINNGPDLTVTTISGNSVTVSQSTVTAGSFEYTLVSVKEGSATMCSQAQSGSATVTIKPTPTSALSASKQDVCPNIEVTLDAHCSELGATVNWNPGGATVTPDAPDVAYIYKASCILDGCTGNESSVEVRTHRILVDIKDVGMGVQPKALAGVVKDNLAPTNTFLTSAYPAPRLWTILASGCSASESAVFKLTGPVSFNNIDNNPPYALFANVGSTYFSIDHPNYGQGAQGFPVGTYNLVVDLRSSDGVGGPFPKNRVAVGGLLATRSLQFTIANPTPSNRAGVEVLSTLNSALETRNWLTIFQNPVSEEIVLQLSGEVGEDIGLNLVNLQGQTMHQRNVKLSSPQQYEVLNVGNAASGMYILKAIKGDQVKSLKVLKVE